MSWAYGAAQFTEADMKDPELLRELGEVSGDPNIYGEGGETDEDDGDDDDDKGVDEGSGNVRGHAGLGHRGGHGGEESEDSDEIDSDELLRYESMQVRRQHPCLGPRWGCKMSGSDVLIRWRRMTLLLLGDGFCSPPPLTAFPCSPLLCIWTRRRCYRRPCLGRSVLVAVASIVHVETPPVGYSLVAALCGNQRRWRGHRSVGQLDSSTCITGRLTAGSRAQPVRTLGDHAVILSCRVEGLLSCWKLTQICAGRRRLNFRVIRRGHRGVYGSFPPFPSVRSPFVEW